MPLKLHLRSLVLSLAGLMAAVVVTAPKVETAQNQPAPAPGGAGQQPPARGRGPAPVDTLGTGPWDLSAGRGVRIHVTAVKGLDHPWGIAFLPDGAQLVIERPGRFRVIRNGVLDPMPIGPLPEMLA